MGTIFSILFWGFVIYMLIKKVLSEIGQQTGNPNIIRMSQNPAKEAFDKFREYSTRNVKPKTASYTTANKSVSINNMKGKIFLGIGAFIVIIILFNIFIVIPAGSTGVRTLFGKVKDKEISSGLHVINPLEHIERMTIRTEEYTMSGMQGEGLKAGADQISALTNEGLPIDLDITVFYHLNENKASDVYRELGLNYQEKIIRPEIRSIIREIIAQYNAKDVYSEKRAEVSQKIQERMVESIEPRGIAVEQVLLRNVTLPAKLSASIQEKLQAEQDAQKYDFILEKEKKEADRKRIEAEGQRDAQITISESLTPKYLQYMYIKELKDRVGTIYVPTGGDGLPLFKSVQ
ncbi:MAG: prohibitin family protein [Candidatus Moraniibacteriota bacterium]|jgi:regulator of protease activity HflC (stomatin/prohibitin superfamily)